MLGAAVPPIIDGSGIFGSGFAGWRGGYYPKYILPSLHYVARPCAPAICLRTPPTSTSAIVFTAAMSMPWLDVIPLVSGG
jgi:hypothetical protein